MTEKWLVTDCSGKKTAERSGLEPETPMQSSPTLHYNVAKVPRFFLIVLAEKLETFSFFLGGTVMGMVQSFSVSRIW